MNWIERIISDYLVAKKERKACKDMIKFFKKERKDRIKRHYNRIIRKIETYIYTNCSSSITYNFNDTNLQDQEIETIIENLRNNGFIVEKQPYNTIKISGWAETTDEP